MTIKALADSFNGTVTFPIQVNSVLDWIRENTDHKDISLHEVAREKKAFRGGFRRFALPRGMYGAEVDIITQIFYGADLPDVWKRLVIVKEALHVFDGPDACVNTPEALKKLIPAVVSRELQGTPFLPALNDHFGAFRAMAVLVPEEARIRLFESVESNSRTVEEVASYLQLPDVYVDIWLRYGEELSKLIHQL